MQADPLAPVVQFGPVSLVNGRVAQPVIEQGTLVRGMVGPVQFLRDAGVPLLGRIDMHLVGSVASAHDAQGQLPHLGGKGGGEHECLLAIGAELVNLGKLLGKAQIKHAVGLIKHQRLHGIQPQLAAALQVQQAAGGGHYQISVLQAGNLHAIGQPAHYGGNAQATSVPHQGDGVLHDLLCQFSGGAQHQGAGFGRLEVARVGWVFAARFFGRCFAAGLCLCG